MLCLVCLHSTKLAFICGAASDVCVMFCHIAFIATGRGVRIAFYRGSGKIMSIHHLGLFLWSLLRVEHLMHPVRHLVKSQINCGGYDHVDLPASEDWVITT